MTLHEAIHVIENTSVNPAISMPEYVVMILNATKEKRPGEGATSTEPKQNYLSPLYGQKV